MSETTPIARPTAADLAFMPSEKIADLVLEGLAILSARDDLTEIQAAQARRLGGEK